MAARARLQVDVLGPLRLRDEGGRVVTPDGELQRRLLALLVLYRGHVVSTDVAVEALWPRRSPRDPVAALQTHIFRLRQVLPVDSLSSSDHGYRLDPAAVCVDADRLAARVAGATGDDDVATTADLLDDALGAWRGPAYPELADVDAGRIESARLEDLRIRAREAHAEAVLSLGRPTETVAALRELVAEHPLRERPHELLMAALAGSGRTVEALRVYDDFRRRLGDELGVEPSPVLAARHVALLGTGPAPPALTNRLPEPVTSLLGREQLLADAVTMTDGHRLVTMLGPGGVGKTRLLVELGHRLRRDRRERPVVLAELATAASDTAIDVVASTLGIDRRLDSPTDGRLAALIGDSEIVLLVDNCEHVLEPVAELVELLLARCPRLTVVATSRERLRLAGEQLCPVAPLPLLDDGGPADELFVERAGAVRPGFVPDAAEAAQIREIVRRLDGLPLAIELAAARLHTLDVADVARGLDRRFRLLAAGHRTAPRHRSLGAAVEWSYGLLPSELQALFCDLSTFVTPFNVDEAAAVAAVDAATAAEGLDALTERSLIARATGGRWALLETLRAFGLERLAADGRDDVVRRRHADHLVDWATATTAGLTTSGTTGLFELDARLPDVATALDWLLDHGDTDTAGALVNPLVHFGFLRLRPDVLAWCDRVLAVDSDGPLAAELWAMSATRAWLVGDVPGVEGRLAHARDVCAARGVPLPAAVVQGQGDQALFEGRLQDALRWYGEVTTDAAIEPNWRLLTRGTALLASGYLADPAAAGIASGLLAEIGDAVTPLAAFAWYCAGEAMLGVDPPVARQRLGRALSMAEASGTTFVTGIAGTSLASIDARIGDPVAAAQQYRILLDHWRRAGVWSTQWTTLRAIAGLLFRLGRVRDAAVLTAAVTSASGGHRVFGEDAVALEALALQLRDELGDADFDSAAALGRVLDGEAAVEHARTSLSR